MIKMINITLNKMVTVLFIIILISLIIIIKLYNARLAPDFLFSEINKYAYGYRLSMS